MKFCIAALLLLFVASVSAQTSWDYCSGTSAGHLTVSSVTLNPDPPARGTDDVVTLTGTVDEVVTGGTISLTIAYGGFFPVYSATYNICDTVTCPYQPGTITSSITVPGTSIPSISPAGEYVGTATLVDQNGASLACVAVTFNLPAFKDAPAQMCPKAAAELMAQFNGVKF